LIDTTTFTEELLGWSHAYNRDSEMPPWWFSGNSPIGQDESLWHPTKEVVALSVSISKRATSVWIWEHKYGLHKLTHAEMVKLLHPKGEIDEPNPLNAEIKGWKGDDLLVGVNWGRDWKEKGNIVGDAVVAWNLETHQWRKISERYRPGGE
jgi:hypothetical protein